LIYWTNYRDKFGIDIMLRKILDSLFVRHSDTDYDLVILDDIFPHLLSPFRITEYNAMLDRFHNAAVYSMGNNFKVLGKKRNFHEVLEEYDQFYPDYCHRVFQFHKKRNIKARLCYLMFLNNANFFIDYLTVRNLPFVLELYPGGGFHLDDEESDSKLRKVMSSKLLRKVIVTQKVTLEYLVSNGFCSHERVEFIFGGVFPSERLTKNLRSKRYFQRDKNRLDICFVAHKYMEKGRDKGYDVFVEVARILADLVPEVAFHVVGPFGEDDIKISMIRERITFYGSRTTDFFPDFYAGMDLILSPNAPHILRPGAFDGFPTGACIEAALCGTAVFGCDELGLNPFSNGEELVIIPRDPAAIASVVEEYLRAPERLYLVAQKGQKRFSEVFSTGYQMALRTRILEDYLNPGR
jgi:glycosyltransferase involved in cell wall biosynthesis